MNLGPKCDSKDAFSITQWISVKKMANIAKKKTFEVPICNQIFFLKI